jgi:uncharacterized DUF497 family protein
VIEFEWDSEKDQVNEQKHGITFEDAIGIFTRPVLLFRSDRGNEVRWGAIGALEGREIAVFFTIRDGRYRIFSARRARKSERRAYREAHPGE